MHEIITFYTRTDLKKQFGRWNAEIQRKKEKRNENLPVKGRKNGDTGQLLHKEIGQHRDEPAMKVMQPGHARDGGMKLAGSLEQLA